jgi:hypothetical protein
MHALPPALFDALWLLLASLARLGLRLRALIDAHVHNARVRGLLDRVYDFVAQEVGALAQTVVPAAKAALADGKLSSTEAKTIRDLAVHRVKANLGPDGVRALAQLLGPRDVDAFLVSAVEAAVPDTKLAAPAPAPAPSPSPASPPPPVDAAVAGAAFGGVALVQPAPLDPTRGEVLR